MTLNSVIVDLSGSCIMDVTKLGMGWMFFLLLGVVLPAGAASVPWQDKSYSHFSDEEPLSKMLETLAAVQDIPIVISPEIDEVVSLHFKEKKPADIFAELVSNYGLIWYYDQEALFIYKENEVQNASVSLKQLSPQEFTNSLKRLKVLDERFQWKISEVDNIIYFTGPERFVSAVLDMAEVMDSRRAARRQIYRWKDANGVMNFSSRDPVGGLGAEWDVKTEAKIPGFDVVNVVKTGE